ncbi:SAM-dependent methyltransferase [Spiractinospora alimapuensis]|uniref:SAM-dependent methyltransferase n=1 Tax=Spiractinospora alimapuensis TaxID=2820884 RepID=UPI001F2363B9|nr:SAM-dependent methyltransferase [Spiractinospora alimapuensis]QVQ53381.1 SAM-dependent methyltransferase [Spiractinospora alimapuensis]
MSDPADFMKHLAPSEGEATPWAETRIDTSRASIARAYDAVLGGKDNFAADREVAEKVREVPGASLLPRDNRAWIGRVVRWLVGEAGIRQVIDIGSGLPTANNVHDFAQAIAPETRVAYVDNDPIVLAHGRAILASDDNATVITADVRDVDSVFDNPDLRDLIDLDEPYAILVASVLHHLPDGEDQRVAAELRARIASGSYLAIANFHDPGDPRAAELETALVEKGLGSGWVRPYPQHRMYFGDLDLVPPGLCPVNEWNPDENTPSESPVHHLYLGGVAQRR